MHKIITKAHRKARRVVKQLERGAVKVSEEAEIDRIIERIEEAWLLERLTANMAFRG